MITFCPSHSRDNNTIFRCNHLSIGLLSQEGGGKMLSSGERGVIAWDKMLSSECSVIISRGGWQMLSSGEGCYHPSVVLSSQVCEGQNVIIWGGGCYHLG